MSDPVEVDERTERVLDGLRSFGANYAEFTRRFASWLGLHSTDAAALAEILYAEDQGAPLSPARLAERIGLTSGATTNLVNRLERAGFVARSREHVDRRIVTLRSAPGTNDPAMRFFGPFGGRLDELVTRQPPEMVDGLIRFLDDLRDLLGEMLAEPVVGRRSDPEQLTD